MSTIKYKEIYTKDEFLPCNNGFVGSCKDWIMADLGDYGWRLGKIEGISFHVARLSDYCGKESLYIPYYPCTGMWFERWRYATPEEVHPHANDDYWIRLFGKA